MPKNPRIFDQINAVTRDHLQKLLNSLNDSRLTPKNLFVSDYMRIIVFKTMLTLESQTILNMQQPELANLTSLARFLIVQKKSLLVTKIIDRSITNADHLKRKQYMDIVNALKSRIDSLVEKLLIFLNEFKEVRDEIRKLCEINEFDLLDLSQPAIDYDFDELNETIEKWSDVLGKRDTQTAGSVLKQILEYEKRNVTKRFQLIPIKIECNLIRASCTTSEEKYLELFRPPIRAYLRKFDDAIDKQRDLFKMIVATIVDLKSPYDFYEYFRNDFFPFLYDDSKFWQMIFEIEAEKEYRNFEWISKIYMNRQSFENCMRTIDYFCKNHTKCEADTFRFIDTIALAYFDRRKTLEELPIENLLEIYEVFEGCGYLSAERYEKYLMTLLSAKSYDDRVRKIALRAVKLHPKSLAVWKAAMTVLHVLRDRETLEKVTNAAYVHLEESERWQIVMQQIDLLLFEKENFQLANDVYLKAIKLPQTYISRPISIMYLRWLNFTRPINEVRHFYDSFVEQNDSIGENIGFVEEMLDIESLTKPIDQQRVRNLYEFLIWNDNRCGGNNSLFKWLAEYYYFLSEQQKRQQQQQQQQQEQEQEQEQQDPQLEPHQEARAEDTQPEPIAVLTLPQLIDQLKEQAPVDLASRFEPISGPDFDVAEILQAFDVSQNWRIDFRATSI